MKFARIILANLFRKKVRLFLTIGSFAVALFLFAFLQVVWGAFHFWAEATVADRVLVTNRASFLNTVPLYYKDRILRTPGIKYITYISWFAGTYQDTFFGGFAIDPENHRHVYPNFIIPDDQWRAFLNDRQGAIAGVKIAERFHWKIGDRIPFKDTYNGTGDWELNLAGIYRGQRPQDDENQFWIHWDYWNEEAPPYRKGQVAWYVLRVDNANESVRICKAIDQEFANSPYETKTQVESAWAADVVKQFTNIESLVMLVGTVVFFTLLLVTSNTMAIAVRERTQELAIFKALGFSDFALLNLVIAESLVPALFGGVLGLALARIFMPFLAKQLNGVLPSLVISAQILLSGLLLAVLFGLVSGIIPGIFAMRMRVITGLRKVV